jgi:acyl dehydratase
MPRLYFEDFPPGECIEYGAYPVTQEAIVDFARQFDPQPFHLDEEAGRASMLGSLSASGWHTAAMVMRMHCDAFIGNTASLGGAGIKEMRWLKPVRPGDVLSVQRRTVSARASSSRPQMGLVEMICDVCNQDREKVMSQQMTLLVERRDQTPAPFDPSMAAPIEPAEAGKPAPPTHPWTSMVQPFEELSIGAKRQLGHYRFDTDAIEAFARPYDPQAFHVSQAAASQRFFGGLIASGWHTAAIWMKQLIATWDSDVALALSQGRAIIETGPSPGIRDLRWLKPVYAGDTISYAIQLVGKRETSRPGWGLVSHYDTGDNQRGERVFEFTASVFWPITPRGIAGS